MRKQDNAQKNSNGIDDIIILGQQPNTQGALGLLAKRWSHMYYNSMYLQLIAPEQVGRVWIAYLVLQPFGSPR